MASEDIEFRHSCIRSMDSLSLLFLFCSRARYDIFSPLGKAPSHSTKRCALQRITSGFAINKHQRMASSQDKSRFGHNLGHSRELIFIGGSILLDGTGFENTHSHQLVRRQGARFIVEAAIQFSSDWHSVGLRTKYLHLHQRHE